MLIQVQTCPTKTYEGSHPTWKLGVDIEGDRISH